MKKASSSSSIQAEMFSQDELASLTTSVSAVVNDSSIRSLISPIDWSYSRRSTFEQCLRRYYYIYFGSSKRTALEEPKKEQLHFLKAMQSRHERTGSLIHLAIKNYLRATQQGKKWSPEYLANFARNIFQQDRHYSLNNPNGGNNTGEKYPPVLLQEYYYGLPNADQLCKEAEKSMVEALKSFATNPLFEQFRKGASSETAAIETSIKLQNFLCQVSGQVDLAYHTEENKVIVLDWKSGTGDSAGNDSLQLGAYALWAIDHFDCKIENLRIYKVYLGSSRVVAFDVDNKLMAAVKTRIIQDAERMQTLQTYAENAIEEAFTPCLQPLVCNKCKFKKVCYA